MLDLLTLLAQAAPGAPTGFDITELTGVAVSAIVISYLFARVQDLAKQNESISGFVTGTLPKVSSTGKNVLSYIDMLSDGLSPDEIQALSSLLAAKLNKLRGGG